MIDESILKYQTELTEILSPLGITAAVSDRDSCYYLTVDGTNLYPTAAQWKEKIGREFVTFINVFVPRMYTGLESVAITETCVEFRIGTIFDMMLRVKEYGDQ